MVIITPTQNHHQNDDEEENIEEAMPPDYRIEAIQEVSDRVPEPLKGLVERVITPLLQLKDLSQNHECDHVVILSNITRLNEEQIRPIVQAYEAWCDEIHAQTGAQEEINRVKAELDESYHPHVKRILLTWMSVETMIESGASSVNETEILINLLPDLTNEQITTIMMTYYSVVRETEEGDEERENTALQLLALTNLTDEDASSAA